jgi:hypothetical protein
MAKRGWFKHSREHAIAAKGRKVYARRRANSLRTASKYLPSTVVEPSGQHHKLGPVKIYDLGKGRKMYGQKVLDRKHETGPKDWKRVTKTQIGNKVVIYSTLFDSEGGESAYKIVNKDELRANPSLEKPESPGWVPIKSNFASSQSADAYHGKLITTRARVENDKLIFDPGETPWEKEEYAKSREIGVRPEYSEKKEKKKVRIKELNDKPKNFGKPNTLWFKHPNPNDAKRQAGEPGPSEKMINWANDHLENVEEFKKLKMKEAQRVISLAGKNLRTPVTAPWNDDVLSYYGMKRKDAPLKEQEPAKNKLAKEQHKEIKVAANVEKGDIIPVKVEAADLFTNGYPDFRVTETKPSTETAPAKKERRTKKRVTIVKEPPAQKVPEPDTKQPLPKTVGEIRMLGLTAEEKKELENLRGKKKAGWTDNPKEKWS